MAHPAPATMAAPAAPTPPGRAALAELTWLNVADARSAFGLGPRAPLRGLADVALRVPARRFSRQLLALDAMVGRAGLRAGSAWICTQLSAGVVVRGPALPERGPLLLVANHPGLLDAAALCSAIPRDDLRILAITRPFLRALPNIAANLFAVGATAAARTAAVRAGARHLRAGGALLTFPAGRIEPDPLTAEGAEESLSGWSDSVDLIARLAGNPAVAPLIVGGVLSPAALAHPLARLRRTPADRQWLAAILQLMLPPLRGNRVRVQVGDPVRAEGARLSETIMAAARSLIREVRQP